MTGRETPPRDAVLHLLDEAGIAEDPALVRAVETIGMLKAGPAPEVTAELARMMADGGKGPAGRRNRRRITFIGGALAVSMGVGMSGVAAGTALGDGLHEAVESIVRFSIRDSADRVHPVPGAQAGPGQDGGRGVVAPSVDAPARSLAEAVPAPVPSTDGESGRAGHAGLSPTGSGPSEAHAVPRDPVDAAPPIPVEAAPGTAPGAPVAAGPPAAVPPDGHEPPAAAPPAVVPPAVAQPVAPVVSAPTPGRERRASPVQGSPAPGTHAPGSPAPRTPAPGSPAPRTHAPGNPTPVSPVSGDGKAGGPVGGNGKAGGQGHEVRQLKQARQYPPAGPATDPPGKGGSSADARPTPRPQGRVWLLAPAGGPVPPAPSPGSGGEPASEQPASDGPAPEQPTPGKRADGPAPGQPASDSSTW